MSAMILIDKEIVPASYMVDPMPDLEAAYDVLILNKYEGSEKEIAEVYIQGRMGSKRVGWLLPMLSLVSIEHDYADSIYFKKHAYEVFQVMNGRSFTENTYFIILSERFWSEINGDLDKECIFVSLAEFGLYPSFEDNFCVKYKNSLNKNIESAITLDVSYPIKNNQNNYISNLIHHKLKFEMNEYARFMYIYQFYELSMEFVFYREMNDFRKKKNHLGTIRDKFSKLSSESKLINLIYDRLGLNFLDITLNSRVRSVFGEYKEDSYYTDTHKASVIYDIRNSLVHSYFRFNLQSELSFFCDYLEMELYSMLKAIYKNQSLNDEFNKLYFAN